jgi:hypothetical protein
VIEVPTTVTRIPFRADDVWTEAEEEEAPFTCPTIVAVEDAPLWEGPTIAAESELQPAETSETNARLAAASQRKDAGTVLIHRT